MSAILFVVVRNDVQVVSFDSKAVEGDCTPSGVFGGQSEDTMLERFVVDEPEARISCSTGDKV
jgi:hypothetical protein